MFEHEAACEVERALAVQDDFAPGNHALEDHIALERAEHAGEVHRIEREPAPGRKGFEGAAQHANVLPVIGVIAPARIPVQHGIDRVFRDKFHGVGRMKIDGQALGIRLPPRASYIVFRLVDAGNQQAVPRKRQRKRADPAALVENAHAGAQP